MKLTYRRRKYPGYPELIKPAIDGDVVWHIKPANWTDDVQHAILRAYVLGWNAARQDLRRHMAEADHGMTTSGPKATRWENADE